MRLASVEFNFYFYDDSIITIVLLFYACEYLCRHKTQKSLYKHNGHLGGQG